MPKKYYAHSLTGRPNTEWQLLEEHLMNVAELSKKFAEPFGAVEWGYLTGLWHDIGKYCDIFQKKITDEGVYHVDHSTVGAQEAVKILPEQGKGKIIAYAISGHHSGLLDGRSNDASLEKRLSKNVEDYTACPRYLLRADDRKLQFPYLLLKRQDEAAFQCAHFIRMIYSCLVDADYLDTEAVMEPEQSKYRRGYPSISELQQRLEWYLADLTVGALPTEINKYRALILKECREKAEQGQGLFSLTVPTGGGKTLSSLAFALKHAMKHKLKRIIYVIPYTSIIEQNADVFRNAIGADAVVEHHSNFDLTTSDKEELTRIDLACENWDAPVIVTTNVQFFESLFANKPSRCRKLHNIAKSVVIMDEAQMLPLELLKPCLESLRALVLGYRTTVVICSATQPAIGRVESRTWGLGGVDEIISNPEELYQSFKRVSVEVLDVVQSNSVPDTKIAEKMKDLSQVLCVVNTRAHARALYEKIKGNGAYHLSALMCPAHRSEKIQEICSLLKDKKECRVVSTQLIEAGVDVDFPVVFRALAGIDSIAQTAGRCNREGRLTSPGSVFMFMPECGLPRNGFLRMRAQVAQEVIRHNDDILSIRAVDEYFTRLYGINEDELDKKQILKKLAEGLTYGDFPFETIARDFEFIDNKGMTAVVIPWNKDARALLQALRFAPPSTHIFRSLQRFTVTVWPDELNELDKRGFIDRALQEKGYYALSDAAMKFAYFDDIGLFLDRDIEPVDLMS